MDLLKVGEALLTNLPHLWTYLLLVIRFTAFMVLVPGLGAGAHGLLVRMPAVLVLALASIATSPIVALPLDWGTMIAAFVSELLLGMAIALIPLMTIAGLETAGQISSNSMGLGAGALIDPTSGGTLSDLSLIMRYLGVAVFFLIGGHHIVVYAASGLGGQIVPGSFLVSGLSSEILIDLSAQVFRIGVMISAPVVVSLLLTQFVMALVSRAVPSVNIFIVSFPLTIGIGLILTALSLPEVVSFVQHEFGSLDSSLYRLLQKSGSGVVP